jgi:hypothetical protein
MPYEHDLSSVALLINMVATPMRRRLLSLRERSTVKPVRNTEWVPDWSSNCGSLPIGDKLGGILTKQWSSGKACLEFAQVNGHTCGAFPRPMMSLLNFKVSTGRSDVQDLR